MVGGEYGIAVEWAEFRRDQNGNVRRQEGSSSGHIKTFGAATLGDYPDLPGFLSAGPLMGPRFTFAPTPNKAGWLSVTGESHDDLGRRIVSFSFEFKELQQTGYGGMHRILSVPPGSCQTRFIFQPDDPIETARLIMRQPSPEWCRK